EVRSNRIFIDKPISESLSQLPHSNVKILTYLVNSFHAKGKTTPYSFVAASSFTFDGEALADNEIVINDWLAKDLRIGVSDTLTLYYFVIGPLRKLSEKSSVFIVKDIIGTAKNGLDNSLMPAFPGLADANSCSDWETGVPIDLERIRDKDEEYWNDFKGTPKAYISILKGKELWESRYGAYTSIRFNMEKSSLEEFESDVLRQLSPIDLNLQFLEVKEIGKLAANNGVGFGELFLSLSFFVIAAGVLLTTLLYSLHVESRKSETGVLSALGFSQKQIIKIRFSESFFIALIGGITGSILGVLYNLGLVEGLNSVWSDIVRTRDLEVFIKPSTLITGAMSGIVIALFIIYLVSRKKLKQPIVELLKKISNSKIKIDKSQFWIKVIASMGLLGSLTMITLSLLSSIEENAGLLLMASGLFLMGSIALIRNYFNSYSNRNFKKLFGWRYLAIKNASLNQGRSIAVIALLALGSFTILITGANRRTFYGVDESNNSGTGGYSLWAESTLPILHDLNADSENNFENVNVVQFYNLEGDDASCLNLNQVDQPQILGVNSEAFDMKGAFSFATLFGDVDKNHPWLALKQSLGKNVIPAYADMTVITWGLKKKIGDTLNYVSESGQLISLVLIGGLNNSIFQGNVLIDDQYFSEHFPTAVGSRIMLIDASVENRAEVLDYLNNNYIDYGIEVNSTSARLAEFNSVTNTYLSVFMVLGGLGVFIGTIGLGIVLLRNLLDRRNEIALLQSLGFNRPDIFKLIFLENFFLLITGMIIGVLAAAIGILPSILSPAFNIPGLFVFIILLIVFLSGILWIYVASRLSLNKYLIQSLSTE
ncbi:MAG: ABC transporter permease, partial [Bacteroidetes bacterium]|nr:ABC transporter permease [Bacteroidota bacterium]